MKNSLIHIAVNKRTKRVEWVKVTAPSDKACHTQCNNALIALDHNDFYLLSVQVELAERTTAPFKKLLVDANYRCTDDSALATFLDKYTKELNKSEHGL